jgi:PAS domain-containing protein
MPDMDGFEAAELIRKRQKSRDTPIIFITASDANPDQIARGYSVGAVDYIFKPFMPEVLKAKVYTFLDLFNRTEELRQSEVRFRTMVTNLPGAMYRREALPPFNMLFVTDPIDRLSGYPASDFMQRPTPPSWTPTTYAPFPRRSKRPFGNEVPTLWNIVSSTVTAAFAGSSIEAKPLPETRERCSSLTASC